MVFHQAKLCHGHSSGMDPTVAQLTNVSFLQSKSTLQPLTSSTSISVLETLFNIFSTFQSHFIAFSTKSLKKTFVFVGFLYDFHSKNLHPNSSIVIQSLAPKFAEEKASRTFSKLFEFQQNFHRSVKAAGINSN